MDKAQVLSAESVAPIHRLRLSVAVSRCFQYSELL